MRLVIFSEISRYIMDYSEESVQQYYRFLEEKYKEIEKLNKTYHSKYKKFEEICPPAGYQEKDENSGVLF